MTIETIEIAGFASALTALRLPYGKEVRSIINHHEKVIQADENIWNAIYDERVVHIAPQDLKLMQTLVKRGDEHAKVIRGIIVYASVTAPIYWWCEEETYRAGHERLASNSTMHQDCRGLGGEELQKAKAEIPMGKELTKVDFFSYQCLRNMVRQRHNHRLQEWHVFVDWVKTLPLAEELILEGLELD